MSLQMTFFNIYKKPLYWLITLGVALLYVLIAIWIPQWSLIDYTLFKSTFTASQKIHILYETLGWFVTANTLTSQILTIVIALLAGINVALLVHYVSRRVRIVRTGGVGAIALVLSIFGVGCGACGSVILSSLFGLTVATGIAGFLPLKGLEFSLLSIVILIGSIVYSAHLIQQPLTCKP